MLRKMTKKTVCEMLLKLSIGRRICLRYHIAEIVLLGKKMLRGCEKVTFIRNLDFCYDCWRD
jgi:hypothetical protein